MSQNFSFKFCFHLFSTYFMFPQILSPLINLIWTTILLSQYPFMSLSVQEYKIVTFLKLLEQSLQVRLKTPNAMIWLGQKLD